jgi:methionine-rich copper-binding protein CopC
MSKTLPSTPSRGNHIKLKHSKVTEGNEGKVDPERISLTFSPKQTPEAFKIKMRRTTSELDDSTTSLEPQLLSKSSRLRPARSLSPGLPSVYAIARAVSLPVLSMQTTGTVSVSTKRVYASHTL